MADTIARQLETPTHARMPEGLGWETLGEQLSVALAGLTNYEKQALRIQ
jgi:hypothetical protein